MKKLHSLTLVGLLAVAPITRAATITVNTADNADFTAGKTNLVTALRIVNDGDTIAFNIPGAGPHYLQTPAGGLPVLIKDNVTIDGYSQPGSAANTNPNTAANNAVIKIVLDSRNGNYRVMEYTAFTPGNSDPPIDNSGISTERGGYGDTEVAILGLYRATNANIRGLAFLGNYTGDPSTYSIAVAHDYGGNTNVLDRLAYNDGSSRGCHVNGCWFGVDPTNQTPAGLATTAAAVAFFRHREPSGAVDGIKNFGRPELPNEGLIVGVKPGSLNPRSQFNVLAYHALTLAGEAIRTKFAGNFLGVMPNGTTPSGIPGIFAGGMEIGRYNDTNAIVLGTDGDGANDADEGNLFGPLAQGGVVFAFYSTSDKPYIVAGNRFGVDINGSLWATNSQTIWDDIGSPSKVQFGSDLDGVSDAWEANVIYNNYPFASIFPDPSTTLEPPMLVINPGARVSFRGNVTVNNDLIPFDYADGTGGRLVNFTNYEQFYMDTNSANGLIPVLSTTNIYPTLSGTFAPGVAPYTNIIIDVYQLDPDGWANGKLFGLQETLNPDGSTNGFPQGKKYLGSFPVANTGSFSINTTGLDYGAGAVTVTVNYSADPPGTHNGRVQTSNFANPAYAIPGTVASVGSTTIVPDTILWFDGATGQPTLGGYNAATAVQQGGSLEPYAGLMGSSTFLLSANTFNGTYMRYNLIIQPAVGGTAKISDIFYADNGTPYTNQINESRQDGNPGRVAGDTRVGATTFVGGGEVSLYAYPTFFNSDGRFDVSLPLYATLSSVSGRDSCFQTYSLNPTTLAQTMLSKATDSAFSGKTNDTPANVNQISRYGGHLQGLSDGNFVSVVEDRSRLFNPNGNASVATIFAANGSIVTPAYKVADADQWANVAAYKNGFAVRPSGGIIYFFNNAGVLQGSINHNTDSGLGYDTGRGDGTRIASDIRSDYVYMAGVAGGQVWLSVWNAQTRTFITKAPIGDGVPGVQAFDRVNLAVDALDRVCVVYKVKPSAADFGLFQVAARVLKFDGTSLSYVTHSFFPFINHDNNGTLGLATLEPSVAMTTQQIFISAKGVLNSTNNPSGGGNTLGNTDVYTVISNPAAAPEPLTITSISADSTDVVFSWQGGTGPFLVQGTAALGATPTWVDLQTTTSRTARIPRALPMTFFRIQDGTTKTVSLFKSVLNGANERPTPVSTPGVGIGLLALNGTTATYWVTYSGLTASASAAHVHGPADATTSAGVMFGIGSVSGTAGVISGTATITAPQAANISAGNSYFNIHTTANPGGEIRGQLLLLP